MFAAEEQFYGASHSSQGESLLVDISCIHYGNTELLNIVCVKCTIFILKVYFFLSIYSMENNNMEFDCAMHPSINP